ncbi:MAG: hypothetical protein ACYTG2_09000 [Planctomycetota bacterium]
MACLALAACSGTEERDALPLTDPSAGSAEAATPLAGVIDPSLVPALEALDEVLVMHIDPALAYDMELALEAARDAIRDADEVPEASAAARVVLDTLVVWHGITSGTATVDAAGRAALEQALLSSLAAVGGQIPQTEMMAATILLESQRAGEAAEVLHGIFTVQGPHGDAYAPAHALARAWRDTFPEPLLLAQPLLDDDAAEPANRYRNEYSAATVGLLTLGAGLGAAATGDDERAIALYEAGAEHFAAALGREPLAAEWDLVSWRADCLVNAGWLHYARAQQHLDESGLEAARPSLGHAEGDFSEAYAAIPEDEEARRGISLTGDLYYQGEDLDGIRDYFGRAAKRFDDAEWWNNHAFFCRETERYEEAYAAYSRCIELAPDNARWVNDTGLILLYHLHRDLDYAEALFRRAWELGRAVTENPFATEEAVEENFLAYTDAMLNIGRLAFERGEFDDAAALMDELLALSPERPDAQMLQRAIQNARESDPGPDAVEDTESEG